MYFKSNSRNSIKRFSSKDAKSIVRSTIKRMICAVYSEKEISIYKTAASHEFFKENFGELISISLSISENIKLSDRY